MFTKSGEKHKIFGEIFAKEGEEGTISIYLVGEGVKTPHIYLKTAIFSEIFTKIGRKHEIFGEIFAKGGGGGFYYFK